MTAPSTIRRPRAVEAGTPQSTFNDGLRAVFFHSGAIRWNWCTKTATPSIGTKRLRIGTLSGTAIAVPATETRQKCRRQSASASARGRRRCGDEPEVLAAEQEAVDRPEGEGREWRDREVDDQRHEVHRDDETEEAQRVADLLAHARGSAPAAAPGSGAPRPPRRRPRGRSRRRAAAAGTISTTESTQHQADGGPGGEVVDEADLADPGQGDGVGQQPAEGKHGRPEHQGEREQRQAERLPEHRPEPRVADLGERPAEVDDQAHASSQVVSAATSGRGRSGGGVAQVPR